MIIINKIKRVNSSSSLIITDFYYYIITTIVKQILPRLSLFLKPIYNLKPYFYLYTTKLVIVCITGVSIGRL